MKDGVTRLVLAGVTVASGASPLLAQGASGSSSISGMVVDAVGGGIPGASVVVVSDVTGTKFDA